MPSVVKQWLNYNLLLLLSIVVLQKTCGVKGLANIRCRINQCTNDQNQGNSMPWYGIMRKLHSPSSYLSRGEYGKVNDHSLQPTCTGEEATSGSSLPDGEASREGHTTGGGI